MGTWDWLSEAIERSGYPAELKAGHSFSKLDYIVSYNRYFLDKDEQKGREIDLSAYVCKAEVLEDVVVAVGVLVICEVKRSVNRPWVVFSGSRTTSEPIGWRRVHHTTGIGRENLKDFHIDKESPDGGFERIGRSYCIAPSEEEARKGKELAEKGRPKERETYKTRIFEALTKVVKASEYYLGKVRAGMNQHPAESVKELNFVNPMVVLDGDLFEAFLGEKSMEPPVKTEHIPISFGYLSPEYEREEYLVDVVTLEGLESLAEKKRAWIEDIHSCLLEQLGYNK
jgi:hypothetical protein